MPWRLLKTSGAVTIRDSSYEMKIAGSPWARMRWDVLVVVYSWRARMYVDLGATGNAARAQGVYGEFMKREHHFSKGKRGPVVAVPKTKERITIRLDGDILGWFRGEVERAGGGNYQTLINDALRQHIHRSDESFEKTLRRVIREEIRRAS
jgi:uncharacterized protein (DUF4415 family)